MYAPRSPSSTGVRSPGPSEKGPPNAALRGILLPNAIAILALRDTLLNGVVLTSELVDKLMACMGALTDEAA